MNISITVKRAGLLAAAAATLIAAAPGSASATVSNGMKLAPGGILCVSQYAGYQVRGEGTATNQGAFFTIESGGVVRASSSTATALSFGTELRSGINFPGRNTYKVCAYNFQNTNTNVTVIIRTDSDF